MDKDTDSEIQCVNCCGCPTTTENEHDRETKAFCCFDGAKPKKRLINGPSIEPLYFGQDRVLIHVQRNRDVIKRFTKWFKEISSDSLPSSDEYPNKLVSIAIEEDISSLCRAFDENVGTCSKLCKNEDKLCTDLLYETENKRTSLNYLIRQIFEDIAKIRYGCIAVEDILPFLCCYIDEFDTIYCQHCTKQEKIYNDFSQCTFNGSTISDWLMRYIVEGSAKISLKALQPLRFPFLCSAFDEVVAIFPQQSQKEDKLCLVQLSRNENGREKSFNRQMVEERIIVEDIFSLLCCAIDKAHVISRQQRSKQENWRKGFSYHAYKERLRLDLLLRFIIECSTKSSGCDYSCITCIMKNVRPFLCCAFDGAVAVYQQLCKNDDKRYIDSIFTTNNDIALPNSLLRYLIECHAKMDDGCEGGSVKRSYRIETLKHLLISSDLTVDILMYDLDSDYEIRTQTQCLFGDFIISRSPTNGIKALSFELSTFQQSGMNVYSFMFMQLEIRQAILYGSCFSELICLSDLFKFEECIHLINNDKLKPMHNLLMQYKTVPILKKERACDLFKIETSLQRTAIFPVHIEKPLKINKKSYDLDQNSKAEKILIRNPKNKHSNISKALLQQSLLEIEDVHVSKKSTFKDDVADFGIRNIEVELVVFPASRNSLDYTFEQIVAGKSQHSTDVMRFEMQRFASFANYDYPDTPSAFDFVKAGWYATGLGKETACFICNIKFSEWRKSLKPLDVHVQLSPECPFIKGENVEAVNVDRTVHQNVNGHANQSTRSEFESLTNGVEQINLTETNGSATCLQPHGFTDNTSSTPQNEYHVNGFSYSPYRDTPFIPPPTRDQTDNLLNGHQLNGFRHVNGDSLSNGQISVDNPSRSSIHSEFVHDSSNSFSSRHFDGHSRSLSDRPHFGNHLQQNNNPFVPFTADIPPQTPLPLGPPAPESGHGYLLPPPISVFSTPKFPVYHPLNVRISSYQGFPSHTGQSPRVLAQAGMFYRGYSDRCSCFWCGIGLQNWSMEDDPWVEHARWSPRCQYLIDAKGEEFIDLVQESYRQEDPVFPALNDDDTMIAELQSIGFSTESIQSAIKTLKSNGRNVNLHIVANFILENMLTEPQAQANENNLPKSDPPSQIGKKEEPNVVKANNALSINNVNSHDKTNSLDENSKSIYEETTAMKEQLTCKVCMDNSVSVVFLPCGHIVACSVCSVRLSKCPICRRYIREKVKTLMS